MTKEFLLFEDSPSENKSGLKKKPFCQHEENTVTIDYDYGIEHCSYCGALGHYNIDTDSIDWTLPQYLAQKNYS